VNSFTAEELISDGTFRDKDEVNTAVQWLIKKNWGYVKRGEGGLVFCLEEDEPDTKMTKMIITAYTKKEFR